MSSIINYSQIDNKATITISVEFSRSMMDSECAIQEALNKAGCVLTGKALEHLDTDGTPIKIGKQKFTSKGKVEKEYETLYGKQSVKRHVYQSSEGGNIFCPMEFEARIVGSTTPWFANILGFKFANTSVSGVAKDLEIGHRRHISDDCIYETAGCICGLM